MVRFISLIRTNAKKLLRDKDERNLLTQIIMAFVVKGLSLVLSLFSMPLYIRFFSNDEVLGCWYTILSMISWVNICDLGLGNGLRNRLTEALAIGDEIQAKKYISSTYAALAVVILPIIIAVMVLIHFVDLNAFFNIQPSLLSPQILQMSISLLLAGMALSFVLRTVNSIIYAIQKSSLNNWISLISSALPLLFVAIFRGGTMDENLISLTVVHVLAVNLPLLIATLLLFHGKKMRAMAPSVRSCSIDTARNMLSLGLQFFLTQIFFMVLTATNEIIITRMFSAADVVDYGIYYRLFTVVGSLFMLALTPLWSKITKDLAQKKYRKIQVTNRVLYVLSGAAILAEFAMVICLQFVVNIWLGDAAIIVSKTTGLIFAFYGGMYVLNVALTTVANGMGNLKTQITFYGIFSAIKIPAIYFFKQGGANWDCVMLYNAIALCAFCIFQLIWIERRVKGMITANSGITQNP